MNSLAGQSMFTTADFASLSWHDSTIYAIAVENDEAHWKNRLLLDIDFIFEWKPAGSAFQFLVAPCTLVFHDVHNLQTSIDTGLTTTLQLQIDTIHAGEKLQRGETQTTAWQIELQNGDIFFEATGFTQYVRKKPQLISRQQLSLQERGGFSFDCRAFED